METSIRTLTADDCDAAVAVINEAADWYREFLPPSEISGPEMTAAEWMAEAERMTWYGALFRAQLVGVMGLEYCRDVALFRHAYVLPRHQRAGVARRLQQHLENRVQGVSRIIIGTYAANYKARAALEKSGFRLSADPQAVLAEYYDIPADRVRSSVTYEKDLGA